MCDINDKSNNKKVYNHYVPQFLLRHFSENKKSISMYMKSKQKYVSDAPINRVAGCNYLYGKTSEFEDWFCEIEGHAAKIINDICDTKKIPNNKNLKEFLYAFFLISETRTKAMADNYTGFWNNVIKNDIKYAIMNGHSKFNGFSDQDIDQIRISVNIPNLDLVKSAIQIAKHIKDLKMILIINDTDVPFILSDCPVVKYNPYLIECTNIDTFGWYHRGILAFLPISNNFLLGLIDTQIYKVKYLKKGKIIISDKQQINELNKLFALHAEDFIFFNQNMKSEYVESLLREIANTKTLDFSQLMIASFAMKSIKNKINFYFLQMKQPPLKGDHYNHSELYRKKIIPSLYASKKEYKKDKKIDYNKILGNIKKSLDAKEETENEQ